jgi:hypothetical protein
VNSDGLSNAVTEKLTTEEREEEKERRIVTTNKWDEEKRPANAPLIELNPKDVEHFLSAESSGRRCDSKGRGSVYNPVLGICCHFCRSIIILLPSYFFVQNMRFV